MTATPSGQTAQTGLSGEPLSGKRKAALFLMSLDPAAARDLIQNIRPEVAQELAAEAAALDAAPHIHNQQVGQVMLEITGVTQAAASARPGAAGKFMGEILQDAFGEEKAREILSDAKELAFRRDPFVRVRTEDAPLLAEVLASETANVIAMVVSELTPGKGAELVGLLPDEMRCEVLRGLAIGGDVASETRARVGKMLEERLASLKEGQSEPGGAPVVERDDKLRKVAVLLRGMEMSMRDELMKSLEAEDAESGQEVRRLMVTWEDVPIVGDRALQEILRSINSKQLALALVGAEEPVTAKVRSNISERAGNMLDEEADLLSDPESKEIEEAREQLLDAMREVNNKGELKFEAGQE